MKIRKMLLFSKSFLVSMSFSVSIENHLCLIKIKKKHINFLFKAVIYFPLSIQMNRLKLYNKCYVILTTYMLDSALDPPYNLSKNLLWLPWILKLIVDMVNDSSPLICQCKLPIKIHKYVSLIGLILSTTLTIILWWMF